MGGANMYSFCEPVFKYCSDNKIKIVFIDVGSPSMKNNAEWVKEWESKNAEVMAAIEKLPIEQQASIENQVRETLRTQYGDTAFSGEWNRIDCFLVNFTMNAVYMADRAGALEKQ